MKLVHCYVSSPTDAITTDDEVRCDTVYDGSSLEADQQDADVYAERDCTQQIEGRWTVDTGQ